MAHIKKVNEMIGGQGLDINALVDEIANELKNITEREYAEQIAENIANKVAVDIEETAEVEHYNSSDVRYAIGRVLVNLTDPSNRK